MDKKTLNTIQKEIIDLPKTKKPTTILGKERKAISDEGFLVDSKKGNFKGIPEALDKIIGETFKPIED